MERAFHNSQWKGLRVLSYDDALHIVMIVMMKL